MGNVVAIKYNPYMIETTIERVDGDRSITIDHDFKGQRLHEWINGLPSLLQSLGVGDDFEIRFTGTKDDFADLESCIQILGKDEVSNKLTIRPILGKEIDVSSKKETLVGLRKILEESPIDEIKNDRSIKSSLDDAIKGILHVNVMALVSAGKSTLINALLRNKLMPAKNAACTKIVTKIKHQSHDGFNARSFDNNGQSSTWRNDVKLDDMVSLNDGADTKEIEVTGRIPFAQNSDVQLVLVDTPGPNSWKFEDHQATTMKEFDASSKAMVLFVVNATNSLVQDEKQLWETIKRAMKSDASNMRDRVIVALNKMDELYDKVDDVQETLRDITKQLQEKVGIPNAWIFPIAARPALDFRTLDMDEANAQAATRRAQWARESLIEQEELHLERYSTQWLTPSCKKTIEDALAAAQSNNNKTEEALIHSGLPSLELAIGTYVKKFARTAGIKNVYDAIHKNIQDGKYDAEYRDKEKESSDAISDLTSKIENIKASIEKARVMSSKKDQIISEKIDEFKNAVNKLVQDYLRDVENNVQRILDNADDKSVARGILKRTKKILVSDAKNLARLFVNTNDPHRCIEESNNAKKDEILVKMLEDVKRECLEISDSLILMVDIAPLSLEKINTDSLNENVAIWLDEKNILEEKISKNPFNKDKAKYTFVEDFLEKVLAPLEEMIHNKINEVYHYVDEQCKTIDDRMRTCFVSLDGIMRDLDEQKTNYEQQLSEAKGKKEQAKKQLDWLDTITKKINELVSVGEGC